MWILGCFVISTQSLWGSSKTGMRPVFVYYFPLYLASQDTTEHWFLLFLDASPRKPPTGLPLPWASFHDQLRQFHSRSGSQSCVTDTLSCPQPTAYPFPPGRFLELLQSQLYISTLLLVSLVFLFHCFRAPSAFKVDVSRTWDRYSYLEVVLAEPNGLFYGSCTFC